MIRNVTFKCHGTIIVIMINVLFRYLGDIWFVTLVDRHSARLCSLRGDVTIS